MNQNKILSELSVYGLKCLSADLTQLQHKDGICVYRICVDGTSYILKYFDNTNYAREISSYKLLNSINVQIIKIIGCTKSSILLEDIANSSEFRLGMKEDLDDEQIARQVAVWYKSLHNNSMKIDGVDGLYCEADVITNENIVMLIEKSKTKNNKVWQLLLNNMDNIKKLISTFPVVLNYNDFYWTNLIVAKDKSSAFMFDYNLLGKGYRYSDVRNVCSSLSLKAQKSFIAEYGNYDEIEKVVDDFVSIIINLIFAYQKEKFPSWANESLNLLNNGQLICRLQKTIDLI